MSPPSGPKHDLLGYRLARPLDPAVPDGFVVTTTVGIDLGRSYCITDATVVRSAYVQRGGLAAPSDVLLAIEVRSADVDDGAAALTRAARSRERGARRPV